MLQADLQTMLDAHGLLVHGSLAAGGRTRVLVGNAGPDFWPVFTASPEFRDGQPDPLDRWSRRIGSLVAGQTGSTAIFPFEGPPYPPFLEWAAMTGVAFQSPVSMFVHRQYGLWHAFRFALLLNESLDGAHAPGDSPCIDCTDQPCLDACPVDAFSDGGYIVGACVDHLESEAGSDCVSLGCRARHACPVGRKFTYPPAQAQFHMRAFIAAFPRSSQ